jgi:Putative MetA-pathway of phenol degradation
MICLKYKAFFLWTLLIATGTNACDICGSGAGGGYMGLLPGFKSKFLSVRYSQNSLRSHLGPGGSSTYLTTTERFQTMELWGAVNVGKRFRIMSFVPLQMISRTNANGNATKNGMGDVSAVGYYKLFNHEKAIGEKRLLMQSFWVGTGIKIPTGAYNPNERNVQEAAQNSFQLGTGSMDYSAHLLYDIRLQNAGVTINSSYRVNSSNKFGYRYGNKFTANLLAYYNFITDKSFGLTPNAGVLYEQSDKDRKMANIEVWETGGFSTMGTVGLEFLFKQFGAGLNYQLPMAQQLGEGKVKANERGMVYLSFSF